MIEDKRIILIHMRGPTPGLWVIAGTKYQLVGELWEGPMPTVLGPLPLHGRSTCFGLSVERPRYIVYREILGSEYLELSGQSVS